MPSYSELIASLPTCITVTSHVPPGAVTRPAMPAPFVPPSLRRVDEAGPLGSPLLLISAPGAVGKSTLAAALASARDAWVWDLSKLQLGSNCFVGTIAEAFGASQLGPILMELGKGRMLFVLDAFDEAEVLSGWQRIETFVREVWSIVQGAPSTAVVLLARSETAALLHMLLHELAGSAPRHAALEVEYFDRNSAETFLDQTLLAVGTDAHRTHAKTFQGALDALFKAVAAGMGVDAEHIWESEQGRSFLGYAPVLQAVARYFAESSADFNKVAGELSEAGGSAAGLGMINALIERLLVREAAKLSDPLKRSLPEYSNWDGWSSLYGRDQQLRCILRHVRRQPLVSQAEIHALPAWLQKEFLAAVAAFVQNHPFVRDRRYAGPAFRDFVLGYGLRDRAAQPLAEAELGAAEFVPTVLLADFHVRASDAPVNARHFGYIYESAIASRAFSDTSRTTLVPVADHPGLHDLEIDKGAGELDGSAGRLVTRLLIEPGSPLTIRSRLRDAFMEVDGALALGVAKGEVELENVQVSAKELVINAQSVIARCYDQSAGVEITAEAYSQISPNLAVRKLGSGAFSATWPASDTYPWSVASSDPTKNSIVDLDSALFALGRIMSWFRRDRRRELARYWELIDNVAVGGHPVRQAMLRYLVQKSILYRKGNFYMVSSDAAANYAINFASIRQRPTPPKLQAFLTSFVADAGT